jgi:hypothetical protein
MAKNATIALSKPDERAEIEGKRGIVRDESGAIIRSPEWKKARKALLLQKKNDCQIRLRNIDAELKSLSK